MKSPTDPASTACQAGFFVDWDGNTRRTESPGAGMRCEMVLCELKGEPYLSVNVIDEEDFVTHEATFFPTIESLVQMDIEVRLVS